MCFGTSAILFIEGNDAHQSYGPLSRDFDSAWAMTFLPMAASLSTEKKRWNYGY